MCDIGLMLTPQCLRPEWGERAISQDGQVTILDLPKAHGIPYMEVYNLQPCTLVENTVSKLPCNTADGNFQSYLLLKGTGREYYYCGLEYCLSPYLRSNP